MTATETEHHDINSKTNDCNRNRTSRHQQEDKRLQQKQNIKTSTGTQTPATETENDINRKTNDCNRNRTSRHQQEDK